MTPKLEKATTYVRVDLKHVATALISRKIVTTAARLQLIVRVASTISIIHLKIVHMCLCVLLMIVVQFN